jgi:hypothetical protein
MSSSLCTVCNNIFEGELIFKLNSRLAHHETLDGFLKASPNCYICRTITTSLEWKEQESRMKLGTVIPLAEWYLSKTSIHATAAQASTSEGFTLHLGLSFAEVGSDYSTLRTARMTKVLLLLLMVRGLRNFLFEGPI